MGNTTWEAVGVPMKDSNGMFVGTDGDTDAQKRADMMDSTAGCSQSLYHFLHDTGLIEPSILEGSFCIMAKISDAASNSSGLVTREPTSETAIGNYSDQDSLEDSGLIEPSIFEGSFCVDQRVAAT